MKEEWKPERKVSVGALGFGVPAGVVLAWVITTTTGAEVPVEVATAFGGLISAAFAYFIPNK